MAISKRAFHLMQGALVLAGALPWALAVLHVHDPSVVAAFAGLCHQRPERTLTLFGAPMVVCSRCAGLYGGVAIGALIALPARLVRHGKALVVGSIALAVLDVATQDLGLHPPWHPARLVTGLLMGFCAAAFFSAVVGREARDG
jgi:uncharacterized membrane protein